MNTTSRIWRAAGLISAVSTLLLLCGFLYAVRDVIYPVTSEPIGAESPEDHSLTIPLEVSAMDVTAIGDSLAKGTGDDTGKGFAKRTVEILKKQGAESKLVNNLGINGLTTNKLLPMLDEPGVQYALKQAGMIMLSIGANDLFEGGEPLETRTELPSEAELNAKVKSASENLKEILAKLHDINPQAHIVYISLYNPFSDLKELKDAGDKAAAQWNSIAAETMSSINGGLVVPTFDLFTLQAGRYLSGDHFHPNGTGYQAIAERIVQGIGVQE